MNRNRWLKATASILIGLLLLSPLLLRLAVITRYKPYIVSLEEAPKRDAALVFGAAVRRDGRLSAVLSDRMDTAIALYKAGTVDQIVVSGHQDGNGYDEPRAMRDYAMAQGVSWTDILVDERGDRTYDTCFRAKNEFKLDSLLLVTQEFHLPRALLICQVLGLDALGVQADLRDYRGESWYEFRETFATISAIVDLIQRDDPGIHIEEANTGNQLSSISLSAGYLRGWS